MQLFFIGEMNFWYSNENRIWNTISFSFIAGKGVEDRSKGEEGKQITIEVER